MKDLCRNSQAAATARRSRLWGYLGKQDQMRGNSGKDNRPTRKMLKQDVLYLMVVNMPTKEEMDTVLAALEQAQKEEATERLQHSRDARFGRGGIESEVRSRTWRIGKVRSYQESRCPSVPPVD